MRSIPKLVAISALSALAIGCQRDYVAQTEKLSPAPILQDDAMAHRNWDTMVTYYANGSSISYPTLYPYVPRTNTPEGEQVFTGTGIFIAQTLVLPITICITPPWQETIYRGIYTPPTYTAVPVTPSDAQILHPDRKWAVSQRRIKQKPANSPMP